MLCGSLCFATYFFKRKTGKKKADEYGGREKPKGNGISPAGWQSKHNNYVKPLYLPCHYAVVFWQVLSVGGHRKLAAFLPVS